MADKSPRALMDAFYTAIDKSFQSGIISIDKTPFAGLMKVVPSNTASAFYSFTDFIPNMREIRDNQPILWRHIQTKKFEVVNRDFESHLTVSKNHILDNLYGQYDDLAKGLGIAASKLPSQLFAEMLSGGFSTVLTFDDLPWFGTHTIGLSSFTNTIEAELTEESYKEAKRMMRSIKVRPDKDSKAIPLNDDLELTLVVHPDNADKAKQICMAKTVLTGGENILASDRTDVIVTAWIENPGDWFLFVKNAPLRPVYYQERQKPTMYNATPETSDVAYTRREYLYGVEARGAALPTLPWLAFGGRPGSSSSSGS